MAGDLLYAVNTAQPVVETSRIGTSPWLNWFRDVAASINTLSTSLISRQAEILALQAQVAGLGGSGGGAIGTGLTVYPLGGGDIATVDNPSLVWMTVRNAQRVRLDWTRWADTYTYALLQVHSEDNAVSVTPRVVAVDDEGAVTRVLGTGTAATSTGTHISGWSPLEQVELEHGSGFEECVLQVFTNAAGMSVSAAGYVECGAAVPSASVSPSSSASASVSPSSSPSASVSPSAS